MGDKKESFPEEMTIHEASEYWDTHSVADHPSHLVQMEYSPDKTYTSVAIAKDFLEPLEKRAQKSGISIETLINLWIQEKLAS